MQTKPAFSQVAHQSPANKQPRRLLLLLGRGPGIALAEQEFNLGKLPSGGGGREGKKKTTTTTTPKTQHRPSQASRQVRAGKR